MSSQRIEKLAEGVTLYNGDCREILPTLGRFDALVTDPPLWHQCGGSRDDWLR
ncbi:hypothetical protein [Methylocystis parvus]|uniref:hypothetical protein n=1 Tax=Methylocystis parvus TaxID=134 RepID=UPI003C7441E0